MKKFFLFFFSTFFFNLDLFLNLDFENRTISFIKNEPFFHKFAELFNVKNVNIFINYININQNWSCFSSLPLYNLLYLTLIFLPLFFSIYIFLNLYFSILSTSFFGSFFLINNGLATFQKWHIINFWNYYLFIFKNFLKTFNTQKLILPNPKHLFYTNSNFFLWRQNSWIKTFFIILFLFVFFDLVSDNISWVFIFSLYFISFILLRNWNKLNFSIFIVIKQLFFFYQKKASLWYLEGISTFFFSKYYIVVPLYQSFFLLFFSTFILIDNYINFLFEPTLTWHGYFHKSLFSYFFQGNLFIYDKINFFAIDYFVGFDGLNLWLIWLTSLLVFLCALFLVDKNDNKSFLLQMAWIFLIQFSSFQFFCVVSYFWMYIFFELSLLPIFVLIVFWGSNWWKVHAAYQMVLFTFFGSLFLLSAIIMLYKWFGTFNLLDIMLLTNDSTFVNSSFSLFEKKLIWIFLFLGFAIKTPIYPFHIWLPEAHSEAPTTGSVLLAGILLKMGTYGFIRFVYPIFPEIFIFYKSLIIFMCLSGVLYSSLAALAQIDIKKIIAYSSIGHMGLVILGICTSTQNGLLGSSFMMISHGLISGALFFSIGILYKIFGTWNILYLNAMAHFLPRFTSCFFFFSLSNMGFPGTIGFPGELLIFTSLTSDNIFISILCGLGAIFSGCYSIWLFTWISYGKIRPKITYYWDLKPFEWRILLTLVILNILFGLFSFFLIDFFKPFCYFLSNIYD